MELKVWVEGIQRIVCGVTDNTTCQDVVYALAHATGKTGRFTLIERWRNNERLLAPHEHPLKAKIKLATSHLQQLKKKSTNFESALALAHAIVKWCLRQFQILTKWGEYSNDVQFILQRSAFDNSKINNQQQIVRSKIGDQHNLLPPGPNDLCEGRSDRNKDIRKSLTFSGGHQGHNFTELRRGDNIGVVKGIPQVKPSLEVKDEIECSSKSPHKNDDSNQHSSSDSTVSPYIFRSPTKREAPPYRDPPCPTSPPHRTLPPYRDPPPPVSSPSRSTPSRSDVISPQDRTELLSPTKLKTKRNLLKDFQQNVDGEEQQHETVLYNAQYRDLVRLVNYQREKLSSLQAELTKCDAEIVFWEGKSREQQHQMEFLAQETLRVEKASRITEDQLRLLANVEEENEIVKQQEKTLKSELTLLRSKLANCETELLQCKNKIRLLLEELNSEQRSLMRESEDRQSVERSLLGEVERLQREVEEAKQGAEMAAQCADSLKREVSSLEAAISDKKRQVEHLVQEMKEANLQSLAIAPAEEIKHLLEGSTFCLGPHKPGSTRKMIGSPRQLENAVPTSKNPHGVWV